MVRGRGDENGGCPLRKVSLSVAFLILLVGGFAAGRPSPWSIGCTCWMTMPGYHDSRAFDINDNFMIVGHGYSAFMCYWDSTGVHDLQRGFGGEMSVTVNDAGTVVAIPMVYSNGTWSWLPTLSGIRK